MRVSPKIEKKKIHFIICIWRHALVGLKETHVCQYRSSIDRAPNVEKILLPDRITALPKNQYSPAAAAAARPQPPPPQRRRSSSTKDQRKLAAESVITWHLLEPRAVVGRRPLAPRFALVFQTFGENVIS